MILDVRQDLRPNGSYASRHHPFQLTQFLRQLLVADHLTHPTGKVTGKQMMAQQRNGHSLHCLVKLHHNMSGERIPVIQKVKRLLIWQTHI